MSLRNLYRKDVVTVSFGTHTDAIRMDYNDYIRLVDPDVINFSEPVN